MPLTDTWTNFRDKMYCSHPTKFWPDCFQQKPAISPKHGEIGYWSLVMGNCTRFWLAQKSTDDLNGHCELWFKIH